MYNVFKSALFVSAAMVLAGSAFAETAGNVLETGKTKSVAQRTEHARKRDALSDISLTKAYADFKKHLSDTMGLTYSIDASYLMQRGAPSGKGTSIQSQYYGTANWNMFSSPYGNGSLQIAYTDVHYFGKNAQYIGNRIGVVTPINDYDTNSYSFDQLSYTHDFVGKMDWLSVTVGQFPMYNFDGTEYDSNQQINFLNYALSQNASESYPLASLGGFVTIAPNSDWSFVVGFQDANNISGSQIDTHNLGRKQFTTFASVSYTPTIEGWGAGQYSLMIYNQPWTKEQPETTQGWSINLSQALNEKWTVFGRLNGTTGDQEAIQQSYVLGAVMNNPFNRNALDQLGMAAAINKLNRKVNGEGTRPVETVLEGYYALGVSNFMTITPDIQFYINPAENKKEHSATVFSLRGTLMF